MVDHSGGSVGLLFWVGGLVYLWLVFPQGAFLLGRVR